MFDRIGSPVKNLRKPVSFMKVATGFGLNHYCIAAGKVMSSLMPCSFHPGDQFVMACV